MFHFSWPLLIAVDIDWMIKAHGNVCSGQSYQFSLQLEYSSIRKFHQVILYDLWIRVIGSNAGLATQNISDGPFMRAGGNLLLTVISPFIWWEMTVLGMAKDQQIMILIYFVERFCFQFSRRDWNLLHFSNFIYTGESSGKVECKSKTIFFKIFKVFTTLFPVVFQGPLINGWWFAVMDYKELILRRFLIELKTLVSWGTIRKVNLKLNVLWFVSTPSN